MKKANQPILLCVAVLIGLFVGLAIGILIGRFGINNVQCSLPNQSKGIQFRSCFYSNDVSSTLLSTASTSEVTPTTALNDISCICPTTTHTNVTAAGVASETCKMCVSRNADISSGNERAKSLFAQLTLNEINQAIKILQLKDFIDSGYSLSERRATHIYLYLPPKSDAIKYLDENGKFPGRFAKVHVCRGASTPPDILEYKVGPLNQDINSIVVEQLRAKGEIHFNSRPYDTVEASGIHNVVAQHFEAISNLLKESFNGAYLNNGITYTYAAMPSSNNNDRIALVYLYVRTSDIITLRVLPVTCLVHSPGINTNTWYASDFYYNSQGPFKSGQEMQNAFDNGRLLKIKFPSSYIQTHGGEYRPVRNESLPQRPLSKIPPPRTYEPQGPRYVVKGQRVTWMDWEFEFTSDLIRGPALFDMRFKGIRIAYEIALQDITLIYATQTSGAGPAAISDTVYNLGHYNKPIFGVDCPERGKVFDIEMYTPGGTAQTLPAICLFEGDGQRALWRHSSSGLADYYLVLRASMNLGNYDYALEWNFHLDGSLRTLITASGFLYGAFWNPDDSLLNDEKSSTAFGYRISDYLLGPIHDHTYLFKIDLDILGINNSFETVHWKAGSVLEAFQSRSNVTETPKYVYFNSSRYLQHELLEKESTFVHDTMHPKIWTLVNENERNVWGVKRGYRVIPMSHSAEVLQDHMMFHSWGHMRFHLGVTRRKDNEQFGTRSWYDLQYPLADEEGVVRMINGETTRNEDLVLWVSEKFLHAPTAEDVPMTLSVPSGFLLKPYNFFDRTPVFDLQANYGDVNPYVLQPCYEYRP